MSRSGVIQSDMVVVTSLCKRRVDGRAQQRGRGRWNQQRPSFLASPTFRGCVADFLIGGDFLCPTHEKPNEIFSCSTRLGCFEHAPSIWQQSQLELFPWLDAKMLQHVFSKPDLPRGSNRQCDRNNTLVVSGQNVSECKTTLQAPLKICAATTGICGTIDRVRLHDR